MDKRSCFFCKAVDACLIEVCCDRYVCSLKCRDQWRSSCLCSSCTISTSTCPSGSDVLPDSVATSSPPSPCSISPSSQFIHLQQSLVSLISSHMLTNLWNSFPIYKQNNRSRHRRLTNKLPTFIQQVGYVSHRFFVAVFIGVKVFFESNTLSVDVYDLPFLLPIACYFQADVPSVSLIVDPSCKVEELLDHTSRITRLRINDDVTNLTHLLDSSSPLFLPGLRCIDFTTDSESELTTFCEALLLSTTIVELSITQLQGFSSDIVFTLVEVFSSVHTFRKVKLASFQKLYGEDELKCAAIHQSPIFFEVSPASVHLSIGTICYQNRLSDDDLVLLLEALKSNVPIKSVVCPGLRRPSLKTCLTLLEIHSLNKSVISFDCFPRCIDLDNGIVGFSPSKSIPVTVEEISALQNLLDVFNIKELSLNNWRFSSDAITKLSDLIRLSTSLTSVDFSCCNLSPEQVFTLISAFESNSCLKTVDISNCGTNLNNLLEIFQLISTEELSPKLKCFPHVIDVSLGYIRYEHHVTSDDLVSLLNALKSNVPINRVECLGLISSKFSDLLVLLEILSINTSVIDLDFSPHLLDIENGVFCFSPKKTVTLTSEEIYSLSSFLQRFRMKELSLIKCHFTNTTITNLCDLIVNNDSLISFDFSKIRISVHNISYLLETLSSKTSLRHLNLSYPILEGNSQSTHDTIVKEGRLENMFKKSCFGF
ncbi:hypothetical protein GEMRC1_009879 [Eukaryota sp. GEM-RC1]